MAIGARDQHRSGIVVAAHSIEIKSGETFQIHNITSKKHNSTKFLSDAHGILYKGGTVDAAFIPITEAGITIGNNVRAHNGTETEVAWGRLADVERLQDITIYGWFNNGPGYLLFKNATEFTGHSTFHNMGIGTYPSQLGDSGSAIVYHGGDAATIVGVHRGSVCTFESLSEYQPKLDVNGTEWCLPNSYYKVFSAWENVENELNLMRPGWW
ncbi:hypothetical protein CENSYa_1479 [Cenarchaeum symbiosum A]|uniref:Uncharacterized protein n=1 Tax=Cenarchaeum symbiosum (strain A) TaxID=414004 RepID=A0RXN4_CENSY|nr:hypothetical protein CENSYa_1479 [Cenarchaeum symbiosum A]